VGKRSRATAVAVLVTVSLAVAGFGTSATAQSNDKPTASEVGVTADTIRIGVVADNDNPFVPGIFKGAADAVQGAAKYINANGGVAGRKLVVDVYDSKLNANETRNAFIGACQKDFALVGTTALFVTNVDDIVKCPDAKGQATGIPDIAGLTTSQAEGCSPVTFPASAPQVVCSTVDQSPQTYQGNAGMYRYWVQQLKGDAHGALLTSNDTPDARRAGQSNMLIVKKAGVKPDTEVSLSSRDPQSAFTPVVQDMKAKSSNFSYLAMSLNSAIELRQEAALQGIANDSATWLCSSTCYAQQAMEQTGDTMDGESIFLTFLPFEESKSNAMVKNFVTYTGKDKVDGFGVWGWAAAIAFQQAMSDLVKAHGVNGVTRTNLLGAVKNIHSFDAGGMVGTTDLANKTVSPCFVLLKWTKHQFVREYPKKQGTFDCKASNATTVKADLSGT
jgi:ABC-type branched-subunit amino acid transport system substrate-binding protein